MKLGSRSFGLIFGLVVSLSTVDLVGAFEVPRYSGLVNDFAGVLDDSYEVELERRLVGLAEQEAGLEMAVVTVESLGGEPIDDVALQFFDKWGIGKDGADNGVLIILSTGDRAVRIQTGYGAEGFLPDSVTGRIIREVMVPSLQAEDYGRAVISAVEAIAARAEGEDFAAQVSSSQAAREFASNPRNFVFAAIAMSYAASFLGRSKSWWAGGVIGVLTGVVVGGLSTMVGLGLFGLVLDYVLSKNYKTLKRAGRSTGFGRTFGGFSSGGSSGGFGGFGGGSSGGGGASGKW